MLNVKLHQYVFCSNACSGQSWMETTNPWCDISSPSVGLEQIKSSCRLVCHEVEVRTAVSVGVHLYRVAPSLYNPILGLAWWYSAHCRVTHQLHPVDGGGRVTVSVCHRVLFSVPNWGITAPDPNTGPVVTLNLKYPFPSSPTPMFLHPFAHYLPTTIQITCVP